MSQLAPEPVVRGALRVLFLAGCYTRNWTLEADPPVGKINALWEALHEIPDLLCRWRPDAETQLRRYLLEFDESHAGSDLQGCYEQARRAAVQQGAAR